MSRYRIFAYTDPAPRDVGEPERWIAAHDQATADTYAERKRWAKRGEIYIGVLTVPQDRKGLKQFGCDAILED